jgi:hypothetical protein
MGPSGIEKVGNVLHRTLSGKRSDAQCAGIARPLAGLSIIWAFSCARCASGGDDDQRVWHDEWSWVSRSLP